jgi:AcrR family transcriptional regulator
LLKAEAPEETGQEVFSEIKKDQIIDAAIVLFSKYGFESTKISDLAEALGVAKGTFYHYFKSKRDLILECIDRLTMVIIPGEVWEQVRRESDFMERQRIKLKAFLKTFPKFSGILNLLRFSLRSNDPGIAGKARDVYNLLGQHLVKDMHRAMENKEIREANVEILSLLIQGMAESLGYIPLMNPAYTYELGVEVFLDFMRRGLLASGMESVSQEGEYWNVEDSEGLVVQIMDIRFNGNRYLTAALREGELKVNTEGMAKIIIHQNGEAMFINKGGEGITVKIDEGVILSGQSPFGRYSVPLLQIGSVSVVPPGEREPSGV